MSKSSEALESLISMYINIQNGTNMIFNKSKILEELNLIKQDLERIKQLEKENQELKELQELNKQGLWNLKQENQKLKNAIDWLKHTFEITLDSKVRISDGIDCIQAFPIDMKNNEVIYELLKEVLEDER